MHPHPEKKKRKKNDMKLIKYKCKVINVKLLLQSIKEEEEK